MQILLRNTTIIDPNSPHHGKQADILITDGTIDTIGSELDATDVNEVIEGDDLHVSIGWMDLFARFGDPGEEFKEDVVSGLKAAASGGFSKVMVSPQTTPSIDSKSGVEYLIRKAVGHATQLLPLAGMTKGLQGEELAEMYDMMKAGAVAISNGKHSIDNPKLMHIALQYAKNLNIPIFSYCDETQMTRGGQMHEGDVSTRLGLKGMPALAEELIVSRDLYLAEYAGTRIHFSHVTTAGSVYLIREAKKKGLPVTASVPAHHLLISHKEVESFDGVFKTFPPFRDEEHIQALMEGLADGTIDAIISDHEPHEQESKFSEFSIAEPGIIALETTFSAALEALSSKLSLEQVIEKLTAGPRKVMNIDMPTIVEKSKAELTVFSPSTQWNYSKEEVKSRSHNSPVLNRELKGLPIAVIRDNEFFLNV